MKEYTIIKTTRIQDQIDEVNDHMKRGWAPVGGICYNQHERGEEFYQGMTRPLGGSDTNQSIYGFTDEI